MQSRCKYGYQLAMFAAVFAFFLIVGHSGPVLFDDSRSYMRVGGYEGVMPVYPMFILLNQLVFGEEFYLWAIITEQAGLAAVFVLLLEETIRKRFGIRLAESILVILLALYPYTIEMPVVMTQAILTEGIAYSFFYLFLVILLRTVWEKSYVWFWGGVGMALFLSALRSQLQILFGVCGVIFMYLVYMRGKGRRDKALRFVFGLVGAAIISMAGIALVSMIAGGYRSVMQKDHAFYRFCLHVQQPEVYQSLLDEQGKRAEIRTETDGEGTAASGDKEELLNRKYANSQYMTLIFSRGMYEADYKDAELFPDPVLKGLYLALYEAADAEKQRYAYAEKGLWMWRDIVGGIGMVGKTCMKIPSSYYAEYAPDIIRSEDFSTIRSRHMQTIGMTLIRAHFGRFLYHTLLMLPQAFISTVFFQYAPLYLLCHWITAFLYLSAVVLMIWGYWEQRVKNDSAEMMALILGINVVMVVVISLVFFGQQRYLVYTFGPFYIAYYLLLRQLWRVRLRDFVKKKFLPGKRGV